MNIDFTLSPSEKDISTLLDGLIAFNAPAFPNRKTKQFGLFVRNSNHEIVGGLSGEMTFTSMFVKYLWVSESVRGNGVGEELLKRLEAEAHNQGVNNLCIDTYTFQAPKFYEKYGFIEVGRFTDYPCVGVDSIFYQKRLSSR